MISFFRDLFDTSGFPARWRCGTWSEGHGWLHILSDIAIFGAYAAIPLALLYFIRQRKDVPFVPIFWLFGAFILSCGFTHLIDATIFWHPWYRLSGLMKVVTAVVSWLTVIELLKILPSALALPGLAKINGQLSEEIAERRRAEEELRESEARYRALVEGQSEMVCRFRLDGTILYANSAYARGVGASNEQLEGSDFWNLIPVADQPAVKTMMDGLTPDAPEVSIENRIMTKGGLRWILWTNRGLKFDADGRVLEAQSAGIDITDRKESETALRESEERFRLVADAAPVLIWISDTTKKCTWFNKGWLDFTGRTMEAESGYGWAEGVHRDDVERCVAIYNSAFDTRQPFEMEYRLRHHDGSYRWLLDHGVPRLDGGGEFLGYIGSCLDISAHKAAEATALTAHRRLQNVLGSITDGLAVLDKDWRYTYFSEQAARIVGINAADVLGGCLWELFPAAKGTKFYEGYHRAVATGQKVEFEEYYPEPINKWLECHCYPSDEGLSVYFRDVTERKQAEATLRQNEALFSTLIEQAPLGVYVVDSQFRLQQVNPLAEPVFSNVRPLIGRDFTEVMEILWGPEVGGEVARIFRHTLETGERYISPPFIYPRADLEVVQAYDWETQRVTLPDGRQGVVCYFVDVTERRRAEAALLEAKLAAEAANQSKDRFLAALSHELRTPLTPVLLLSGMHAESEELSEDLREDFEMIRRNIVLEAQLIDDLLDIAHIQQGKMRFAFRHVDVDEVIARSLEMLRSEVDAKGIAVRQELRATPATLTADPARLRQVLCNLLRNAVKFTPNGGTITVQTARDSSDLQISITDTGAGIVAEDLERIFQPFEQVENQQKSEHRSLGLGLAISTAIVAAHQGRIWAESPGPGQGSTLHVRLPI